MINMVRLPHHRWCIILSIIVALLSVGCGRFRDRLTPQPLVPVTSAREPLASSPTLSHLTATPNDLDQGQPPSVRLAQERAQFLASPVTSNDDNRFVRGAALANSGRVVLIPRYLFPAELTAQTVNAMVTFVDKIAVRVELFDSRVAEQDGAGIAQVDFQITEDTTGETRFVNRDNRAPFCLFGGNEPLCHSFDFAETGLRWPSGEPLYNGRYTLAMVITTTSGDRTIWHWSFAIAGTSDRPNRAARTTPAALPTNQFTGFWYTNFAEVRLQQEGTTVTGTYTRYGQRETLRLTGTVTANQLDGFFGDDPADRFRFRLGDDGQSFAGAWFGRSDGTPHDWCGVRIGAGALPDGCGFSGEWLVVGVGAMPEQAIARLEQIGPNISGIVIGVGVPMTVTPMTGINSVIQNGTIQNGAILANLGEGGVFPFYSARGLYTIGGVSYPMRWDLLDFNSSQFQGCLRFGETVLPWCGRRSDGDPTAACNVITNCP